MLVQEDAYSNFINSIKSEVTKQVYEYNLKLFMEFCGVDKFEECMCLNISERKSLSYLKDRGYSISSREFYRIKNQIKESTSERLNLIASEEFMAQHLERIDMLKTIQTELWASIFLVIMIQLGTCYSKQ